jgi:hypothetical protein
MSETQRLTALHTAKNWRSFAAIADEETISVAQRCEDEGPGTIKVK